MNDFWSSWINRPHGLGIHPTVREAVDRLEEEGFADSQGPMARQMLWRRRMRRYIVAQDRQEARDELG